MPEDSINADKIEDNDIYKIEYVNIPERLKNIPRPPKHLYVIGKLPDINTRILCIVGSRKHSRYAEKACRDIISGLNGYDICIVSGLALGIDTIVHKSALDAGLKTVAFPGSGLHPTVLYPYRNINLAKQIVNSGGALISEFELKQGSMIWTFPQRNRLMAGISELVIIVEAQHKSGTLITANLAVEYNREVGAVPGQIDSPLAYGPNRLIKDGAIPITCSDDILEIFGFKTQYQDNKQEKLEQNSKFALKEEIIKNLNAKEIEILEIIRNEPHTSEDLILKTGFYAREVNEVLSSLEIQELIIDTGNYYESN